MTGLEPIVAAWRFTPAAGDVPCPKPPPRPSRSQVSHSPTPTGCSGPKQGITKRALAEFYAGIADRILPHVVNRPLTLVRCPSGSDGACFVQKHPWAGLHEAVRRVHDGGEEWLAVEGVTGLVALVQMGVLELHPWGATIDDLERPDRIIFDLDPDEGVPWTHLVEGARAIHAALDDLGLRSFAKATGGRVCMWWSRSSHTPIGKRPRCSLATSRRGLPRTGPSGTRPTR